jgi:D-aminopeptidase
MKASSQSRRSARELGIIVGELPPGPRNAITDVKDVRVGHVSLRDGDVNTGVTVVMPYERDAENALYTWGRFIFNGNAEMTGLEVLEDFGQMSSPIFMTNAVSVGRVYNGAITYGYTRGKGLPTNGGWPPVVLSVDDRYLNNMRKRAIHERHALEAIDRASSGMVEEGTVGAGSGAMAFGFKGGIGTSSRRATTRGRAHHVGVLTLANHGRRNELKIDGVAVGRAITTPPPATNAFRSVASVVATDAPMTPRQLNELAKRAGRGLMQTGGLIDPEESCIVVSFSNGIRLKAQRDIVEFSVEILSDDEAAGLFKGAAEAAEESVLNALFAATPVSMPQGHKAEVIPVDRVRERVKGSPDRER